VGGVEGDAEGQGQGEGEAEGQQQQLCGQHVFFVLCAWAATLLCTYVCTDPHTVCASFVDYLIVYILRLFYISIRIYELNTRSM
jgi:hypothetical protein